MPRIVTNTTYESFFWVEWNQVSQDIPGNKTKISWACGVSCGHSFYLNAIKMSAFTINGVQVYGGGTYSNYSNGNHTIASGTLDIGHNTDGTKTFSISSFTGWLYSNHNYSSNGGSFSLQQIPRKATITASPESFTDQDNPSITISNPGGFTMDVWLEPNPNGDHLCIREGITLDANGRYTWELSAEEREQLRWKCPGKDCTIRIGVYTHIGDTVDADYRDKKFIMVESDATRPAVTLDVSLVNGFENMYIQGKSRVGVDVIGVGKYGSSISSLYATLDGKTYNSGPFTSDAIQGSGYVNIIGYAKDSREITGSAEETIYVHSYSKPLVVPIEGENAIQCYRSDSNGKRVGNSETLWVKAGYTHTELGGQNQCRLHYRSKKANSEWSNTNQWNMLLGSDDGNTYDEPIYSVKFDKTESYTIQIKTEDDVGEQDIKTFEIPTEDVALHLGKGGKNVAVGTYCDYSEDHTFYSDWKAIFDKEVVIGGQPVANHVVEEGTVDAWKYRKWSDGSAELWGMCRATHSNGSVLGGSLRYPFALTGNIYGIGTLNSAGGNGVGALPWNLKVVYNSELCEVWVHNSGSVGFESDSTADISVYIVGRWRE